MLSKASQSLAVCIVSKNVTLFNVHAALLKSTSIFNNVFAVSQALTGVSPFFIVTSTVLDKADVVFTVQRVIGYQLAVQFETTTLWASR